MEAIHEKNINAYESRREEFERDHLGKVVLLHDGECIGIYNDTGEAYQVGCHEFGLGEFTIQRIGDTPISLGIFTLNVGG